MPMYKMASYQGIPLVARRCTLGNGAQGIPCTKHTLLTFNRVPLVLKFYQKRYLVYSCVVSVMMILVIVMMRMRYFAYCVE